MKFFVVMFLFALSMSAQNHTVLTLGFGRTPATEVYIVNDVTDGSVLNVHGSGEKIPKMLGKADRWEHVYHMGYGDAPIFIEGCILGPTAFTITAPPDWARDERIVGGAALTTQYLLSNPPRSDLKARVRALEVALKNTLGGKLMIGQIKSWLDQVNTTRLEHTGPKCIDPKMISIRVRVQDFWYERLAVMLTIRGSHNDGYKIDGPRNAWY